jgi:hypothetical protein
MAGKSGAKEARAGLRLRCDDEEIRSVSLAWTAVLAGIAAAIAVFSGWMGARPARALSAPRLVPWRLVMLLAFAVAVIALGHAVSLIKGR